MRKINIVHGPGNNVLTDYLNSLNFVDKFIPLNEFNCQKFIDSSDIYLFTQMWLNVEMFPIDIYKSDRLIFLNVEMLSEGNRWGHLYNLIKNNVRIADYSITNINIIKHQLKTLNQPYSHEIIYLPYQYNYKEVCLLENTENQYTYDIGIINAFPRKDSSVHESLTYKRTEIFNALQQMNFNIINILGWGEERDEIIKKCKIIINVHHFEVFNVFEHMRCDRLLFANKIIISDKSLFMEELDIFSCIIWKNYEDIIHYAGIVLNDFDTYQNKLKKTNKEQIILNRLKTLKQNYSLLQNIN
jgi:hypothetical protein